MISQETSTTNYRGASSDAIQHHYDLSNDFFEIWLDRSMTYSCALWDKEGEDLEVAQARKLDYLIESARLPKNARVLEIGCGWGSLLKRLVEEHGARQVVGLTLAKRQAEAVRRWAEHRSEILGENWIDHRPIQPYDGIISIGAFEHFAKFGMMRADRVAAYRKFFQRCAELLPQGGHLALQTICKGGNSRMNREMVRDMKFVIEHIFPESELPWPAEIAEASQGIFEMMRLRNDPEHYGKTCKIWHDNLQSRRERAELVVGNKNVDDYLRYLRCSSRAFFEGHIGLLRMSFKRI